MESLSFVALQSGAHFLFHFRHRESGLDRDLVLHRNDADRVPDGLLGGVALVLPRGVPL